MSEVRIKTRGMVDRTGNGFCGPLTLAAILGISTGAAAEQVRRYTGKTVVKGMYNREVQAVLEANGYRMIEEALEKRYVSTGLVGEPRGTTMSYGHYRLDRSLKLPHGYTLEGAAGRFRLVQVQGEAPGKFTEVKRVGPTLAEFLRTRKDINATHILVLPGHYVLVKGRKFIDTHTGGEWVFLRSAPHRRKRVQKVFRVEKV